MPPTWAFPAFPRLPTSPAMLLPRPPWRDSGALLPISARKCQFVSLFNAFCVTSVFTAGIVVQWERIGKEVTTIYLLCQDILCYFVPNAIEKHLCFLKRKE
jgi:hypothetical protein